MILGRLKRGELGLKSGLKQEKSSNYTQVFYTSRGGGSKAPIRRTARWGLLVKLHGTSLKNFNFNPRVCFYDYFCMVCTGHRT